MNRGFQLKRPKWIKKRTNPFETQTETRNLPKVRVKQKRNPDSLRPPAEPPDEMFKDRIGKHSDHEVKLGGIAVTPSGAGAYPANVNGKGKNAGGARTKRPV